MDIATLGLKIDGTGAIAAIDGIVKSLTGVERAAGRATKGVADDLRATALGARDAASAVEGLETAASSAGLGEAFADAAEEAKKLSKETNKAAKETDGLAEANRQLKKALATLGVGLLVREYVQLADKATLAKGSLMSLGLSGAVLAETQDRLRAIAIETRSDLGELATLYSRTARATQSLKVSQKDIFTVITAVTQAAKVNNATQAEAAGAIRQLTQAFGSGVLRGEELNSVMEQMPRIADAIAEELGVTTGELRKLAAEGLIPTERVFNALLNSAPKIASEAGKMASTVEQAKTALSSTAQEIVKRFEDATGLTGKLSQGMLELAKNIPLASALLGTAGLAGATWAAVAALKAIGPAAAAAGGGIALLLKSLSAVAWPLAAVASTGWALYEVFKVLDLNKQIKQSDEYVAELQKQVKARNELIAAGKTTAEINAALEAQFGKNLIAARLQTDAEKKLTAEQLDAIAAQKERLATLRGDKETAIAIGLARDLASATSEQEKALLRQIAAEEIAQARREKSIELAKEQAEAEKRLAEEVAAYQKRLAQELKDSQARMLGGPLQQVALPESSPIAAAALPPEEAQSAWTNFLGWLATEGGVTAESLGKSLTASFNNIVTRGKASFGDLFNFLGGAGLGKEKGGVLLGFAANLAEMMLGGKARAKAAREAFEKEVNSIADGIENFSRSFRSALGAFQSDLERAAQTNEELSKRIGSLLTITARRALDAAGGDVGAAISNLQRSNVNAVNNVAIAQLEAYRKATDDLTESYKAATAAAKAAQERRRAEAREDNEVRRLRATGQNEAADRLAMEIRFGRELADALREGLDIVSLMAAQSAEWAAFVQAGIDAQAEAERQRSYTIRSLDADILAASGDTAGAEALRRQLERDKVLADITDETIRLKYEELWVLEDVNRAAKEAADALKLIEDQAKLAEDYEVRRLQAMGKNTEAEELRFKLTQQRELMQAQKDLALGLITQELYDTLVEILGLEATNFANRNAIAPASPLADGASDAGRQTSGTLGSFASAQVQDIDRVVGELTTIRIRMGQLVQYMARFTRGGGVVGAVNASLQTDTNYQQVVNGNLIVS